MLELPGGEHAVPRGNILTLSSQGSQSFLLITALNEFSWKLIGYIREGRLVLISIITLENKLLEILCIIKSSS